MKRTIFRLVVAPLAPRLMVSDPDPLVDIHAVGCCRLSEYAVLRFGRSASRCCNVGSWRNSDACQGPLIIVAGHNISYVSAT